MSNAEWKTVMYILFWWNVAQLKELPDEILDNIQDSYKTYFNFSSEREARSLAPSVGDALQKSLPAVNDILLKYEIQLDNVAVLSYLYFFCEYMLDRTTNSRRAVLWDDLMGLVTDHPLHRDVMETNDYEYLDRIEKSFIEIMSYLEKIQRINQPIHKQTMKG